jgi:hypothetical protein
LTNVPAIDRRLFGSRPMNAVVKNCRRETLID